MASASRWPSLDKMTRNFADKLKQGDVAGVLANFTPDAQSHLTFEPQMAATPEAHRRYFEKNRKAAVEITQGDWQKTGPRTAVGIGFWNWQRPASPGITHARWMIVAKRRPFSSRWRIYRLHSSVVPSAA